MSLVKKNYLLENIFQFNEKRKIGDDGKVSSGHVSIKDYLTWEKIQGKFEMKNMGDYHEHYFKKDVLQLAVCEKFIGTCLKYYGLDPCHYRLDPCQVEMLC